MIMSESFKRRVKQEEKTKETENNKYLVKNIIQFTFLRQTCDCIKLLNPSKLIQRVLYISLKKLLQMKCIRSIISKIKEIVTFADCFAPPILLRYNSLPKKSTKTGGCISIILLIVLAVFFLSSWFDVLDKKIINSESYIERDSDPELKQITKQDFMFSISIAGLDIYKPQQRYFDLLVTQQIRINSTYSESYQIEMEPCQKKDFQDFGEEFVEIYENLKMQNSLCFPDNLNASVRGKWASPDFRYIRVHLKRCSGEGCINDFEFQEYLNTFGAFYINYYFINKLINPNKLEPITIYFQDKNYNMVNDKISIDTNLYLSQYIMETDQSLWPWQDLHYQRGIYVDKTEKEQFIHPAQNGSYVQFHLRKSDQKMMVKRSFRRIDNLLSYIGGLFGISATLFGYVISRYNRCCFQLEICSKIFSIDGGQKRNQHYQEHGDSQSSMTTTEAEQSKNSNSFTESFNFVIWIKYLLFELIKIFYEDFTWKSTENFAQKLEESRNQMNVDTLLHKIAFYERAFQCLFDDDQILLLYLQEKISIEELKRQRLLMNLKSRGNNEEPGNQVANEFVDSPNNHNFDKNSQDMTAKSLAMVFGALKVNHIEDLGNTIAKRKIEQEMAKNFGDKVELTEQMSLALERVKKRANMGEKVCQRILEGVCKDLLIKFQQWETEHTLQQRCSFSQITGHRSQKRQFLPIPTPPISGVIQLKDNEKLVFDGIQEQEEQQQPEKNRKNRNSKLSNQSIKINILQNKNSLPFKKIAIYDVGTMTNI